MKKTMLRSAIGKHQKGFALISTYLVVTLLAAFSFAYFERSNAYLQASERNQNKVAAFNMAEAGVDFALSRLMADSNYTGTTAYTPLDTPSVRGGYTVSVTTPNDNPNIRIIQANGFSPDNVSTSRSYQAANIATYCEIGASNMFDFAVFARNNLTLTSTDKVASVDSYNSNNGDYDPDTASSDGDIAVNSIAAGAITLDGKTIVKGDASIGPGGDVNVGIDVGNNATMTGTKKTLQDPQNYPMPSTNLPSSGDLDIQGGTHFLLPGTYHFSSIRISGNGQIDASAGGVTIYVDGALDIEGNGIATNSNKPPNLLIFVTGSEDVKVAGNGTFYGGIYAPNSTVRNSGSTGGIFGAVIANNYVQTGNGAIHFDEAMREVQSPQPDSVKITAWQEQNSLTWGT